MSNTQDESWFLLSWLQVLNASFPCQAEVILIMMSVALVPHFSSCLKGKHFVKASHPYKVIEEAFFFLFRGRSLGTGASLLLLAIIYSGRWWLHPEIDARSWFHRSELTKPYTCPFAFKTQLVVYGDRHL